MSSHTYQILANCVLMAHFGVVLFIIGGLILILFGVRYQWQWVRNFWFRMLHLSAIAYVLGESWLGIVCPLTSLEQWLREQAGQLSYEGDFVAHWLGSLMFYQAPPWVFIAAYSVFTVAVVVSWVIVPPQRRRPDMRR